MNIIVRGLQKSYSSKTLYENFNITFKYNRVNCILGESGCGKTTLLNFISGTLKSEKGRVEGIDKSRISYVFQEDRLIEWKTLYDNLDIPLRGKLLPQERREVIDNILQQVGLKGNANNFPGSLSGGMRQRASIARAFCYPSDVLIMDEPFKSLDPKNKEMIIELFKGLLLKKKKTVLYVTHDVEEALELGEEIFVLGGSPVAIKGHFTKDNYLYVKEELREKLFRLLMK